MAYVCISVYQTNFLVHMLTTNNEYLHENPVKNSFLHLMHKNPIGRGVHIEAVHFFDCSRSRPVVDT